MERQVVISIEATGSGFRAARQATKAGQEEKLAEQLRALVAPTRAEAGCLRYELHRDPKNPAKFMFYERFGSQAA